MFGFTGRQVFGLAVTSVAALGFCSVFGLFKKNQFIVKGKTVVITGGSDGLGKYIAMHLAQRGAHVIIVARNKQKLNQAIEDIQQAAVNPEQRFLTVSADLTNPEDAERAISEATAFNGGNPPDIVWCCAGNCSPGFFASTPMSTHRSQMDTVYWTAAYTAHAILQKWLEPAEKGAASSSSSTPPSQPPSARHLIFTSSTLAFTPVAGYAPYSPAKAAMRSLADTLNQEIEVYNGSRLGKGPSPSADIKMHVVFPMGILTPGYENEQLTKPALTKKLEETDKPQTPDEVALITLKALEKGEYLITTTFVGMMMKASALASSARNCVVKDTILGWLANVVFLAVMWDLNKTAREWGRKMGILDATK